MKRFIFLSIVVAILSCALFAQPTNITIPVTVTGTSSSTGVLTIPANTFVTPQQVKTWLDSLHQVIKAEMTNIPPVVVPPVVTPGTGLSKPPYPASNTNVYGSATQAYDLNNMILSTANTNASFFGRIGFRFRAMHTGLLTGIRIYCMGTGNPGYGAGNGSTWRVTLRKDSTTNHTPAQTYMAIVDQSMQDFGSVGKVVFPLLNFNTSAKVDSGTLYHVVFENIDPDQVNNYSSVNTYLMYPPLSPMQPFASDLDWCALVSTVSPYTTWKPVMTNTPIMGYYYSDGYLAGFGYGDVARTSLHYVSGNSKARETFTVTVKDRVVSAVSIWMKRESGIDPLLIRLEQSNGTLIDQGYITATLIPITTNSVQANCSWVTCKFLSNRTLSVGQSYNLVLSTASSSSYSLYAIGDVTSIFGTGACFSDGKAQITLDGSSWSDLWNGDDLQFYFVAK